MNEARITAKIMAELRRRKIYAVKIQGGAYQQPGLPDIWCVVDGRLICLEVKTERGVVSRIQRAMIERLRAAGAVVEVVRSVNEALEVLGAGQRAARQCGDPQGKAGE